MDETFRVFHRVLSFIGVPIFSKTSWDSKIRLCHQIFNFIIAFFTFVFTTGSLFTTVSDRIVWIEAAGIWTTGVIMFISLTVCLIFRQKFREFLNEMAFKDVMMEMPLIEYTLKLEGGGKLNELKQMVVNSQMQLLKYTRVLLKTYVFSVVLCATLYVCDSIYQMVVREDPSMRLLAVSWSGNLAWYLATIGCNILPVSAFQMWFPWGLQNFKVYIASFIFHAYAGYLCGGAYPGLQSTIIFLIGQIIRQLRILAFILQNLDELAKELVKERDGRWQMYCTIILTQCIDHYSKIKRFSNRLNVICRPFYLALILVATLLVCVCSVKIAISDKLSPDTMKYYFHEICFILMVLMFCALGQQVENECEKLERVVTEKWYIYNKKHKVNVLIFEMALSHKMPIYIFGSITLSLPTFTWFLRTGMSFFTLVMSVLEADHVM